jgi:hypothetical protein
MTPQSTRKSTDDSDRNEDARPRRAKSSGASMPSAKAVLSMSILSSSTRP